MLSVILFTLFGYLTGSILFANIAASLYKKEIVLCSRDNNPGTANAFTYGGFRCGLITLIGDLLKGFIPVSLYLHFTDGTYTPELFIILSAPVIGHILPLFFHFKGGKGIATTFGSLLGMFPYMKPVLSLAFSFIFFSVIIQISSHFYRTIAAYITTIIIMLITHTPAPVIAGYFVILAAVILKLINSNEEKERCRIHLLWMH